MKVLWGVYQTEYELEIPDEEVEGLSPDARAELINDYVENEFSACVQWRIVD